MAGDWIKMRSELQTHPKIVRILSATKADKFRVVGGLHAVWSVFDQHSVDGVLFGYTPETLDHIIGWEGFASAMIAVKWLSFDGEETLSLPEFDEHNGQSAKRRAEDQKRKRNGRKTENSPESVHSESGQSEDKKRTREEKRREEVKEKNMSGKPDDSQAEEVIDYLNEKANRSFQKGAANLKFVKARIEEGATLEQIKAVIDVKVKAWALDPKMAEYLRPETLFNATKFASYVGQLGAPAVNGQQPPRDARYVN